MKKSLIVYEMAAVAIIGMVGMCNTNSPTTPNDVVGPVISLVTPAEDSATTASSSYTVTLRCTDASGVLSVNGVMGSTTFTGVSDTGTTWKIDISGLAANTLTTVIFTATDNSTHVNRTRDTLHLIYNPDDRNILLSEGFEGDLSNYRQITYQDDQGKMSIATLHAHSGNSSLTSDSNNTGIKRGISPSIDDSIAGLQFYLMATKLAHTNFFAAICKPGSSDNGLFTIIGMGIDKSDSLKYIYENVPGDTINEHKNFAAFTLNKWYKCKIEYNFSDTTLTYFLDNDTVYIRTAPSPMTLQIFVVMRDGLGAQGTSGYYIDDVSIYKR